MKNLTLTLLLSVAFTAGAQTIGKEVTSQMKTSEGVPVKGEILEVVLQKL